MRYAGRLFRRAASRFGDLFRYIRHVGPSVELSGSGSIYPNIGTGVCPAGPAHHSYVVENLSGGYSDRSVARVETLFTCYRLVDEGRFIYLSL